MDYEHYLCGLLFPRDVRKHYFAVRAFNIELAIIKDVISSSSSSSTQNIGTMRLDFWRQVINSCYKVRVWYNCICNSLVLIFARIRQAHLLIQSLERCVLLLVNVNYLDIGLRPL